MHYRRLILLTASLCVVYLGCTSLQPVAVAPSALHIQVEIESTKENPRVVKAIFTNTGSAPFAFSETFGFGAYAWIGIRVRKDGEELPFYEAEIDLFRKPPYRCLKPGESLAWVMDLSSWHVQVGGRASNTESFSFNPPPGEYQLQVKYTGGNTGREDCAALKGTARSAWVPFEVM